MTLMFIRAVKPLNGRVEAVELHEVIKTKAHNGLTSMQPSGTAYFVLVYAS